MKYGTLATRVASIIFLVISTNGTVLVSYDPKKLGTINEGCMSFGMRTELTDIRKQE
jgi:hypothetical protein